MKTVVDGNLVLVDDVVAIEKDRGKYKTYVANDRFKDVLVYENNKPDPVNLTSNQGSYAINKEYDPKYYYNGENNLTVDESAEKAAKKIAETIFHDQSYRKFVAEGCKALIKNRKGRDACYKLAAQVKKLHKDGFYGAVNPMVVFHAVANDVMSEPEVTERISALRDASKYLEYDPVWYVGGNNGLTVEESAKRATSEAKVILGDYSSDNLVYEGALAMIKAGQGRQAVYKLAGAVKKGFYNGEYKGVTRSVVFNNIARGYMSSPV